jgi:HPt (histidine-containing phosphotransfer) domain-containing protein
MVQLATDQPPVLDSTVLDQLRELLGDRAEAALGRLFDTFLLQAPRNIVDARVALETSDAEALARAVHVLKGSSGQIGALRLRDVAAAIELDAKAGRLEQAGALIETLELELVHAKAMIEPSLSRAPRS